MPWARLGFYTQSKVGPSSAIIPQLWLGCLGANHWVHREHIYRRHQRPTVKCTRCLVPFDSHEKLAEHLRAEIRCENKTPSPDEEIIYITPIQERELRKKKKNILEEERWFSYFRIIFPDIPDNQLPSPCKPKTARRTTVGMSTDDRDGKIMSHIKIHCPVRRWSVSFAHSWSNNFRPVLPPTSTTTSVSGQRGFRSKAT